MARYENSLANSLAVFLGRGILSRFHPQTFLRERGFGVGLFRHPPGLKPAKDLNSPKAEGTPSGLPWQHQRKVKNTQVYEFDTPKKNGRMQWGI